MGTPGNKNALKNGSTVNAHRLIVGELPKTMVAIKREGLAYRVRLEGEVIRAKGSIDVQDAHLIDTAAAATSHAGLCRWLLRNRLKEMSVSDIRGCSAEIIKAKKDRDAAVKALGLNIQTSFWVEAGGNGSKPDQG